MRALLELVSGLVLLMASFAHAWTEPSGFGLAPFPTEAVVELCGSAPESWASLPDDAIPGLVRALTAAEPSAVQARICAARTREEASYGLAILGIARAARGEEGMLRIAADRYANPIAMAALARAANQAHDRVEATRYRDAARALAGVDGVTSALGPVGRGGRADPTDRFVARRLALHHALYGRSGGYEN